MAFVSHLGWTVLSPVLPLIQAEYGVSVTAVALVASVYGVSRLVTSLPAGILGDRLGHRRLLIIGCLALATGSVLGAVSASFSSLLISRLVSGVGACLMVVTNTVLMSNLSTNDTRGRDLGLYQAAGQAGNSISPAVAGVLAGWAGWRAPLWFSFATALLTLGVILLMPELGRQAGEVERKDRAGRAQAKQSHLPSVLAAQFISFILFFGGTTFSSTYVPLFGSEQLRLSPTYLGLLLSTGTLIRFGVSLGTGVLSDKWGRRSVLVPTLTLSALGMGLVVAGKVEWLFVAGTLLVSLGRVGNGVPNTVLADHLPASRWGAAIGLNRFLGDLGLVLGPALMGLIIDVAGMGAAGVALAVAMLAGAAAALLIRDMREGALIEADEVGTAR